MSDTVYIGITGQTTQGSLSPVVQGSTDTVHTVTVKGGDGTAHSLTGKTVTGLWWHRNTPNVVYEITGTLTVTDAANGVFTWDKSAADVGSPGSLMVQFVITDGAESDATFPAIMAVNARGEATNVIPGDVIDGGSAFTTPLMEIDGGDAEGV